MSDGHYGKFRGTVTDNNDPDNQGRVKAKVPAVLHDVESGWALPAAPYAGGGLGSWAIPPKNAGVWIEFEGGNSEHPIWSGCWWAGDQRPEDQDGNKAVPSLKILRSEQGLLISLDDDGHTVSVSDKNGDNFLKISVDDGTVKVQGSAKVVVEAPQIQLVENSTHPLVFGDDLLQYLNQLVLSFNTHVHAGELAIGVLPVTPMVPAVPLTPPEPSMLSLKVTTG
jgi:uncharacterized protein involved in type VI secretion and phage assembly